MGVKEHERGSYLPHPRISLNDVWNSHKWSAQNCPKSTSLIAQTQGEHIPNTAVVALNLTVVVTGSFWEMERKKKNSPHKNTLRWI